MPALHCELRVLYGAHLVPINERPVLYWLVQFRKIYWFEIMRLSKFFNELFFIFPFHHNLVDGLTTVQAVPFGLQLMVFIHIQGGKQFVLFVLGWDFDIGQFFKFLWISIPLKLVTDIWHLFSLLFER